MIGGAGGTVQFDTQSTPFAGLPPAPQTAWPGGYRSRPAGGRMAALGVCQYRFTASIYGRRVSANAVFATKGKHRLDVKTGAVC